MFRGDLDGSPLQSAALAQAALAAQNKSPIPEVGYCNRLVVPAGPMPARGWVLLTLAGLSAIDLDGSLTLHFEYEDDDGTLTPLDFYNLVVTREPLCLTPGYLLGGDSLALYLVEISDARWVLDNPNFRHSTCSQYNVRAPAYVGAGQYGLGKALPVPASCYYLETLDRSDPKNPAPWTWADMAEDLWGQMETQLGPFPGLPGAVGRSYGTPEGWSFVGAPTWKALCTVLTKLGCMVRPDLTRQAGQYTIVRIGAPDPGLDATLAAAGGALIHDGLYRQTRRGLWPRGVRVHFHRLEQAGAERTTASDETQWAAGEVTAGRSPSGRPVYTIDVDGPDLVNTEPGIYHPLFDDLPAVFDSSNNLLNEKDLLARTKLVAADYYRLLQDPGGTRLWQRYSGLWDVAPGSTLKGVTWVGGPQQGPGRGVYTEIQRHPFLYLKAGSAGAFEEAYEESTRLHAPNLRSTHPVYPEKVQTLRIVGGSFGSVYDAQVQVYGQEGPPASPPGTTPPASLTATLKGGGSVLAEDQIGATLYYAVTAVTGEGESGPSPVAGAAPTLADDSVSLSWPAVPGATSYKVYRGTVSTQQTTLLATVAGTTFTDDGSLAGEDTQWRDGEFVWGMVLGGKVFAYGDQAAAKLIGYRKRTQPGPAVNAPVLSAKGSLAVDTPYFWVVTAVLPGGESYVSAEVTLTPTSGNQTAGLSWHPVDGATSYRVYRSTISGTYDSPCLVAEVSALSYADLGAGPQKGAPTVSPVQVGRPLYQLMGFGPPQTVLDDVNCVAGNIVKSYRQVR